MYNHFVCQLSNTRLMDANKKYKKQLDDIDKEHNFIILRTLHGGNYETEMFRSMILEKLHHIYKSLCFTTGTMGFKTLRRNETYWFYKKTK